MSEDRQISQPPQAPASDTTAWPVLLLAVPSALFGIRILRHAILAPFEFGEFIQTERILLAILELEGMPRLVQSLAYACGLVCVCCLALSLLAILYRRPWTLRGLRASYWLGYALVFFYAVAVFRISGMIYGRELLGKKEALELFRWRRHFIGPYAALMAFFAILHLNSWRRAVLTLFSGAHEEEGPARGDVILEDLRSHGRDPQYRKSVWSSISTHILVIIVLPWLLGFIGCYDMYRVPKGSGNPVVALVKIVKPKKKKKKKYLLNPKSAISFYVPDLDDSRILEKVIEATQMTYKASPNARPGKMGAGGGKTGGWPDGMDKHLIRFIRLEYRGSRWDDGMDSRSRADLNFLKRFHELTGFKVAKKPESIPMRKLAKWKRGYAPPFVYMTGDGGISAANSEIKVLRKYLLEGGMLFADAGSPSFHQSFTAFMRRVFPDKPLLTISDDDPLFLMPYQFPNGPPPLWHHGGFDALGIKYKGRWCVFYHPGDINDAWKTGHSGLDRYQAEDAFDMGINILYYAFTNYLESTRDMRK